MAFGLMLMLGGSMSALGAGARMEVPEGPVIPEGVLKGCQLMKNSQPYPGHLKRAKTAGQVLSELEISKSGKVENVVVLKSTPEGAFDSAAKEWFKNLRCPKSVPAGIGTRFQFLLVFNLPDNLGDPIDGTIPSWVITGF